MSVLYLTFADLRKTQLPVTVKSKLITTLTSKWEENIHDSNL